LRSIFKKKRRTKIKKNTSCKRFKGKIQAEGAAAGLLSEYKALTYLVRSFWPKIVQVISLSLISNNPKDQKSSQYQNGGCAVSVFGRISKNDRIGSSSLSSILNATLVDEDSKRWAGERILSETQRWLEFA
jgi:hypothetical protein